MMVGQELAVSSEAKNKTVNSLVMEVGHDSFKG